MSRVVCVTGLACISVWLLRGKGVGSGIASPVSGGYNQHSIGNVNGQEGGERYDTTRAVHYFLFEM